MIEGKERRAHDRVNFDVSARIFNPPGEIVLGEGKIMDISIGGARLITTATLNLGDVVQLEFVIYKPESFGKDKLSLTCEVETVWKSGEKDEVKIYGVKYVNLSAVGKELLLKVVDLIEKQGGEKINGI